MPAAANMAAAADAAVDAEAIVQLRADGGAGWDLGSASQKRPAPDDDDRRAEAARPAKAARLSAAGLQGSLDRRQTPAAVEERPGDAAAAQADDDRASQPAAACGAAPAAPAPHGLQAVYALLGVRSKQQLEGCSLEGLLERVGLSEEERRLLGLL